jgi:hypothetical protein
MGPWATAAGAVNPTNAQAAAAAKLILKMVLAMEKSP